MKLKSYFSVIVVVLSILWTCETPTFACWRCCFCCCRSHHDVDEPEKPKETPPVPVHIAEPVQCKMCMAMHTPPQSSVLGICDDCYAQYDKIKPLVVDESHPLPTAPTDDPHAPLLAASHSINIADTPHTPPQQYRQPIVKSPVVRVVQNTGDAFAIYQFSCKEDVITEFINHFIRDGHTFNMDALIDWTRGKIGVIAGPKRSAYAQTSILIGLLYKAMTEGPTTRRMEVLPQTAVPHLGGWTTIRQANLQDLLKRTFLARFHLSVFFTHNYVHPTILHVWKFLDIPEGPGNLRTYEYKKIFCDQGLGYIALPSDQERYIDIARDLIASPLLEKHAITKGNGAEVIGYALIPSRVDKILGTAVDPNVHVRISWGKRDGGSFEYL